MFRIDKTRLPNDITHARFVMIPFFLLLFWAGNWGTDYAAMIGMSAEVSMVIAVGIWIVAYISDVADGYLARLWKVTSPYGALLDPLADKLIVLCAILLGIRQGWFPLWLAIVLEGREAIATAIRMIALESYRTVISSGNLGKRKADAQMTGLTLMLASLSPTPGMQVLVFVGALVLVGWCVWSRNVPVFLFAVALALLIWTPTEWWYWLGLAFLLGSAVLSLWSLVQYARKFRTMMKSDAT